MDFDPFFWRVRALQYATEVVFSVLVVIFSGAAWVIRKVATLYRNSRSEHWPMTNGAITTCDVKTWHGRFTDYAIGTFGYSYRVNDDYYAGYYSSQFYDEQRAWEFIDARREKQLLVRYKADDPAVSSVREQDQPGGL
jgi:hypothetical protein